MLFKKNRCFFLALTEITGRVFLLTFSKIQASGESGLHSVTLKFFPEKLECQVLGLGPKWVWCNLTKPRQWRGLHFGLNFKGWWCRSLMHINLRSLLRFLFQELQWLRFVREQLVLDQHKHVISFLHLFSWTGSLKREWCFQGNWQPIRNVITEKTMEIFRNKQYESKTHTCPSRTFLTEREAQNLNMRACRFGMTKGWQNFLFCLCKHKKH